MFSDADNSNIEINVNKGANGMSEGTISIGISEYKQILELAYKAAMLKEAVLNAATLDYYCKELNFIGSTEVNAIFKYAFPDEYDKKLRELQEEKAEKDKEDE